MFDIFATLNFSFALFEKKKKITNTFLADIAKWK